MKLRFLIFVVCILIFTVILMGCTAGNNIPNDTVKTDDQTTITDINNTMEEPTTELDIADTNNAQMERDSAETPEDHLDYKSDASDSDIMRITFD